MKTLRFFCLLLLASALLPQSVRTQAPTSDSLFPRFHPRPHAHWLNDPSGPVYYNGLYHLFNQYNPKASSWGSMSWSHLISYDLVFWMEMPVAMVPDQWYDSDGVFTGSITTSPDGRVIALYTCAGHGNTQRQCVAYPRDLSDKYLQSWVKLDKNPVIPDPPAGGDLSQFRDPTTAWKVGDKYYMAVAAQVNNGANVWLYSTTDPSFATWTSEGPLFQDTALGAMFECPDFFPLTNHTNPGADTIYAMKLSEFYLPDFPQDFYRLGKYDTVHQKFIPVDNAYQLIDHGRIYASKRFYDPKTDRHIWYGWVTEDYALSPTLNWASSNTLPRALGFNQELMVMTQQPIPELSGLRVQTSAFSTNFALAPGDYFDASNSSWNSAQFEVLSTFDFSQCYPNPCVAGLTLLSSPDATQATNVYIAINEPVGPFDMQQLVVPHPTYYRNVSMPSGLSRSQLVEGCRQFCLRDHMCVSWTYFGDFAAAPKLRSHAPRSPSHTGSDSHSSSPPQPADSEEPSEPKSEPESPTVELMGLGYNPINPTCQLSSGSDLDPTFNIHSYACTDCASGLDYSDTLLPLLVVDRSISGYGGRTSHFAVVPVGNDQRINTATLRAFVDHSVVEVFVDDVVALTARVYPDQSSTRWGVFGGVDNVADIATTVQAWQLMNAVA